jgi:hypothetical protein
MDAPAREATIERRRHRTEDTLLALSRLLEAARQRNGLDALAVTDSTGLLLAGAGASRLCDELAAWAPVVARGAANDTVPTCLDVFEGRTRLQRLRVDGVEIVVASLGKAPAEDSLEAVSAGCRRILTSPARAERHA